MSPARQMTTLPKNILVVRNDKLGDFLVSLPAYACIKSNLPDSNVVALVPDYTREIAERCPYIDDLVIDPGRDGGFRATLQLARLLKYRKFDSVVTLFSTGHTGLAVWLAGIPYRLAPATKLAQVAYNHKLKQRRSASIKPEHEYNLDLIKKFLSDVGIHEIKIPRAPYLVVDPDTKEKARASFLENHGLGISTKLIFVHAGSGGSSNNLSIEQYADLVKLLDVGSPYHIVLSAGPGEINNVNKLSGLMKHVPHTVYESSEGLDKFVAYVSIADLFIGGSTGPLHIAGALDIPTAAFYVRLRTSSALRWQTINSPEKRLAFSPEENFEEEDMSGVDLVKAAGAIRKTFLS